MAERGIIFKDDFVSTPSKSWFDLSYDNIFSSNFGELVPTTCMECMAEDVIHAKSDSFTRLAPMVAPAFGKVNQFSYHFYVRNRDIWTHWDSFFTNSDQKKSWQSQMSSSFIPPVMPYINVRRLLYNDMFTDYGGMQLDCMLWSVQNGTNTGKKLTSQTSTPDVYQLVLWEDTSNVKHATIINGTIDDWARKAIIITYIPNKDEYDPDRLINRTASVTTAPYYNPFSDGSLFDYLGVDLYGMYREQMAFYLSAQSDAHTNFPSVFDLGFSISDDFAGSQENGRGIPYDYNFEQFFCSHAVIGVTYYNSSWFTMSALNKYITDGGSYNSGSYGKSLARTEESAKISALPLRAYYFVYLEYFRDQNYIDVNPCVDFTRDGDELNVAQPDWVKFDYLTLKIKAWEHDPYTTALPQAQRGPAVHYLPSVANVSTKILSYTSETKNIHDLGYSDGAAAPYLENASTSKAVLPVSITADLSAATIENFRFANATQRYLEKVARSGSRYYEYMRAIFGADIQDAKLNRPIYLGGDKTPIQVSEVLQTSASQMIDDQPLGQMAGRAIAIGSDDYLEYVTPDNGFFIELSCIIPRVSYQQGLKEMFTRKLQLDYPIPEYAQLGEEIVKTGNLYYSADDTADNSAFGYQSRYWSWKYNRDETHGAMKNNLDHWTFTRKFVARPYNGKEFIEVRPDYRQFAVTDKTVEHAYTHMFHDIQVQRALPIFGVPSL